MKTIHSCELPAIVRFISLAKGIFFHFYMVSVYTCTNLTPQHTMQATLKQVSGISGNQCFDDGYSFEEGNYATVFCPQEEICGFSLCPENTSTLEFLSTKSCVAMVKNTSDCDGLKLALQLSGKLKHCQENLQHQIQSLQFVVEISPNLILLKNFAKFLSTIN